MPVCARGEGRGGYRPAHFHSGVNDRGPNLGCGHTQRHITTIIDIALHTSLDSRTSRSHEFGVLELV